MAQQPRERQHRRPNKRVTKSPAKAKKPIEMKVAASFFVHNVPGMSLEGRKRVVEWMRKQARYILKYGDDYTTKRFTARYLYADR